MLNLSRIEKDLRKNLKTLLIILGVLMAGISAWAPLQVYVQSLIHDQYEKEFDYIDKVSGVAAYKIKYYFELQKLCDEYKKSSPPDRVSSDFYGRFNKMMSKNIEAGAMLEQETSMISAKLDESEIQMLQTIIRADDSASTYANSYCTKRLPDWTALKTMERNFNRASRKKIAPLGNSCDIKQQLQSTTI